MKGKVRGRERREKGSEEREGMIGIEGAGRARDRARRSEGPPTRMDGESEIKTGMRRRW